MAMRNIDDELNTIRKQRELFLCVFCDFYFHLLLLGQVKRAVKSIVWCLFVIVKCIEKKKNISCFKISYLPMGH